MAPVGAAPVNSLFADPNGKVWQYVAQISRGEKIAGVEGLRNLATSEAGRKALLANPAVLEPLVNQIQLAGALPGEDGVAVSLAAATLHSLAEAPGAGPPLAVLSSQVLVPSLLRLAGNGSDTGKQQALAGLSWLARLGAGVARAIVEGGGATSLPSLLQHATPAIRTSVALLIETLEEVGVSEPQYPGFDFSDGDATSSAGRGRSSPNTPVQTVQKALSAAAEFSQNANARPVDRFSSWGATDLDTVGAILAVELTPAAVRCMLVALRDKSEHTQQAAAGMLGLCASISPANKGVIFVERAVEMLVARLLSAEESPKVQAAGALLQLCKFPSRVDPDEDASSPEKAKGRWGRSAASAPEPSAASASVHPEDGPPPPLDAGSARLADEHVAAAAGAAEELIRWLVHSGKGSPSVVALLEQLCYDIFHLHLATEQGQVTVKASKMDRLALQVLRKRGPKLEPLVEGIRRCSEEELEVMRNGVAVLCSESHAEIIAAGALEPLVALVGPACIEALLTNLDLACRHPQGGDAVALVKALVEISTHQLPENPLPALVDPLVTLLGAPELAAREVAAVAIYTLCKSGDEVVRLELARSGALTSLVNLVGEGSLRAREAAVGVVCSLLELMAVVNVEVATSAEAASHLATVLREGSSEGRAAAAAALCLCATTPSNKGSLVQGGCVDALARTVATGSPMAREHAHHALLRLAEPLTTSTPQSLPGAPPPPKGGWGTWLGIGRKPANDPQQAVAAEVNYLVELASTGGSGAEEAVTALIELFRELYEHREGDEGELEGDQEDEDEAERGGERAAPAAPPPAAESAAAAGAAAEAVPSKRDQSAPPASAGQADVDPVMRDPPELHHGPPEPLTGEAKAKAEQAAVRAALSDVEELMSLLLVEEPEGADGQEGPEKAALQAKVAAAERVSRVLREGPDGAKLGAARAMRLAAADAGARAAVYKAKGVEALVQILRAGGTGKAQKEAGAALVALADAQVPVKPTPGSPGWFWSGPKETQEEREFKALEATAREVRALVDILLKYDSQQATGSAAVLLERAAEQVTGLVCFMFEATGPEGDAVAAAVAAPS